MHEKAGKQTGGKTDRYRHSYTYTYIHAHMINMHECTRCWPNNLQRTVVLKKEAIQTARHADRHTGRQAAQRLFY